MRAAAAVVDQGITEMQTKVSLYIHRLCSLSVHSEIFSLWRDKVHTSHLVTSHFTTSHTSSHHILCPPSKSLGFNIPTGYSVFVCG